MDSYQNWNNTISYIKSQLGARTTKLELSDDEIIEELIEHVIPFYSKYDKDIVYYKMCEKNIVLCNPVLVYTFDKTFKRKILDIEKIIHGNSLFDDYNISQFAQSSGDITDYLVLKNYQHIYESIQPIDGWKFRAPNKIIVTKGNSVMTTKSFIAIVNCVHVSPLTMEPTYYDYFKDLAAAHIMMVIGRIRSKFEDFSTPMGQIKIRGTELVEEGKRLWQETKEELKNTPPDVMIEFF